ncbi:MAG TPA: hypothetical protein VFR37_23695 [Longimicrobium sp.]|nr:hypothetical protein [Longimicrobium sp.]
MSILRAAALLLCFLAATACGDLLGGDVEGELERELRSVEGPWQGTSYGSGLLTLSFQLQEGTGTAVSGSGTMKEASAPAAVPITVTGTFVRPHLSLTFTGMVFEGHAVQGTFQGDYTTVGGLLEPLHLTGTGYTREIQVLLGED